MTDSHHYYAFDDIRLAISDDILSEFPSFTKSSSLSEIGECDDFDLCLERQNFKGHQAMCLSWHKLGEKKPLRYCIDYVSSLKSSRSFPAPKQGAFNQALGNKSKAILDATGGWGNDALLMAMQGYSVTVLERNPIMALLMEEGFSRLSKYIESAELRLTVPTVHHIDSINAISRFAKQCDCAYLDPMFPPKRKKSAATNKQMQLLQWLIGEDVDAATLLEQAIKGGFRRIAVKRPDYAQPLYKAPSQQFSSKLVHYDVYLQN